MKKQTLTYLSVLILILLIGILLINHRTIQTITFFPIDKNATFKKAKTTLSLSSYKKDYFLTWATHSSSDEVSYLRQDVSLIFANGKLKGVKSKWRDHTDTINMEAKVSTNKNILWETISFHHGEIQYSNSNIRSIQQMTHDYLYIIPSSDRDLISFRKPNTISKQLAQQEIDREIKKKLLNHWNKLATHFNLSLENYDIIPFMDLYKYNDSPLPNMTKDQTKRVLGQLWEGLYKNYVIPATQTKDDQLTGFAPVILLDKNQNHIIVLFELNNKKDMLIQQLSDF